MDYNKAALEMHSKLMGKISISSKVSVKNKDDLSIAYTPGVAEPCRMIHKNAEAVYTYTSKANMIAVVSDGSAVLGLGNIGAKASIPVMEGKCVLFKEFGDIDAFPICLETNDVDEIVKTVQLMEPVFGGINLEDISAPRCFEIEKQLKKTLSIPVFHDDQHGTAIVVAAAIINALKLIGKEIGEVEAVVNGAGAAGNSITKLLLSMGIKDVVVCDRQGILDEEQKLDPYKAELAGMTNKKGINGSLADAFVGKDIFIGVSAPNIVTMDMIASMNEKSIVFPMANPVPEIMPDLAVEAGAYIVGTGRSDYPNQVNNVLAFPGIFKGALAVRASDINEEMKIAAAYALAEGVGDELSVDNILPKPFQEGYSERVAEAVKQAAIDSGVARI